MMTNLCDDTPIKMYSIINLLVAETQKEGRLWGQTLREKPLHVLGANIDLHRKSHQSSLVVANLNWIKSMTQSILFSKTRLMTYNELLTRKFMKCKNRSLSSRIRFKPIPWAFKLSVTSWMLSLMKTLKGTAWVSHWLPSKARLTKKLCQTSFNNSKKSGLRRLLT